MEYTFFFGSIIAIVILFFISIKIKRLTLSCIIIGISTIGFSLVVDILFGDYFKLYYYLSPKELPLYAILSAIFIYPLLNIIYILFLPKRTMKVLIYTLFWIIFLLIFEYCTLQTKTIVFTGWKPYPWSVVLYIVAYSWIYSFYRYLSRKIDR